MKNLFQLSKNCRKHFNQMMLIARFLCKNHLLILGSYSEWYRNTFSEMRYKLKIEEFKTIIEYLKGIIQLEGDPEIIQIHIDISIPAPIHCNEMVLVYKQFLRTRLSEFENQSSIDQNQSMNFEEEMEIN